MKILKIIVYLVLTKLSVLMANPISKPETHNNDSLLAASNHRKEKHTESNGSEYISDKKVNHHNRDHKGYKEKFLWDENEKGSHHRGNKTDQDKEDGASKKSQIDEADSQNEYHEKSNKNNNGKQKHKKTHKKGSKSIGYHKKISKNEFTKTHKFYDEKSGDGNHEKHGENIKEHKSERESLTNGANNLDELNIHHQSEKEKIEKGYNNKNQEGYQQKQRLRSQEMHHEVQMEKRGKEAELKHGIELESKSPKEMEQVEDYKGDGVIDNQDVDHKDSTLSESIKTKLTEEKLTEKPTENTSMLENEEITTVKVIKRRIHMRPPISSEKSQT